MLYQSELTGKTYTTAEECEKADLEISEQRKIKEAEKKKEAEERKAAADRVEAARKTMVEAQNAYREEIEHFCEKYHTYHTSWRESKDIPTLFESLFNLF